jgi:hypothetical protein
MLQHVCLLQCTYSRAYQESVLPVSQEPHLSLIQCYGTLLSCNPPTAGLSGVDIACQSRAPPQPHSMLWHAPYSWLIRSQYCLSVKSPTSTSFNAVAHPYPAIHLQLAYQESVLPVSQEPHLSLIQCYGTPPIAGLSGVSIACQSQRITEHLERKI